MGAMGPERSRSLHNFCLPSRLTWGAQKLLRCSNHPDNHRKRRHLSPDFQIDAVRESLMLDLRSEVDKMRAAILGSNSQPPPPPPPPVDSRPWNLRARRAACKETPPTATQEEAVDGAEEVAVRAEFAVALSREEIEEDFMVMVGRRPPRKPKKRARYVQKNLDTLFPGLWLSEVNADIYKVNESPEPPK